MTDKLTPVSVVSQIKDDYFAYSMAVLHGRAIPDLYDGLKPAARRLLQTMWEENLKPDGKFVKCARVTGLTMAFLHPQGSCYGTLVNMATEWGGQGMTIFEQVLSQEQLGRSTNALWDVVWRPANVLKYCTPEQRERFLIPEIEGKRRSCYAITEADAGSDPSVLATKAVRDGDGFILTGEKWYVTVGDVADYQIVVADVPGEGPVSLLIDRDQDGVEEYRRPRYMHHFVYEHPIFRYHDVEVSADRVLGEVGEGYNLTKEWFMEERLMIAARCLGGAERCLEDAFGYAVEREQFGERIIEFQGVSFPLAEAVSDLAAARAFTYQVAWEVTQGTLDPKTLHAKAASIKLFASEMANRVVDSCVQVLGGRGYMRENAVERFYRDLRVDRIWEGTSEIQKVVLVNEMRKRGTSPVAAWPKQA
jgi:alkylation response protein AidB-like acyl-CoA dehydrogenase